MCISRAGRQAASIIAHSERWLDVSDCVFCWRSFTISPVCGGLSRMALGRKDQAFIYFYFFSVISIACLTPWHSRCPGAKVKSRRLQGASLVSQVSTSSRHPRHPHCRHWKGVEESMSQHIRPRRDPRAITVHVIQGERGKGWKTNMRYKPLAWINMRYICRMVVRRLDFLEWIGAKVYRCIFLPDFS